MTSGGARARSGPAPDPNALRRDRAGDVAWVVLPAGGYDGLVPVFPLPDALTAEVELWETLWRKPQAHMWAKLELEFQVASYVRAFLRSVTGENPPIGLLAPVLRMAEEIGLSLPGMARLNWKFAEDELGARRSEPARKSGGVSAKDRLRALNG